MSLRTGKAMVAIRVLCALALLLVSFAHKPIDVFASKSNAAEIAQYVMPDGQLPVLCLPGQDGDGAPQSHGHVSYCDACLISSAFDLPLPAQGLAERLRVGDAFIPLQTTASPHYQAFSPNIGPRGPPRSITI